MFNIWFHFQFASRLQLKPKAMERDELICNFNITKIFSDYEMGSYFLRVRKTQTLSTAESRNKEYS